jgi:hypothetical protein
VNLLASLEIDNTTSKDNTVGFSGSHRQSLQG